MKKAIFQTAMNVFDTYKNLPQEAQNSVVVIGNFDGVHRGHVALLERAKVLAEENDTHVSILTFEPHPRKLFRPDDPPFRLTPPLVKAWRLETLGIESLFSVGFDWDFASQSADDFVEDILINGLKAAHVVVGYNFRFGQLRKGEPATIETAGISVSVVDEVVEEGDAKISSSQIRQALRHGRINEANNLLGWEWEMRGEVIKGDQRGRELGYPTANFPLGDMVHPSYGVYAARVQIEGEDEWHGAAINIGIKPMFEVPQAEVESYIFDFDRDIYGKTIRVQPVQFLRGEAKFDSVDELITQMDKDCEQARDILQS